jgi:hypothetical protein
LERHFVNGKHLEKRIRFGGLKMRWIRGGEDIFVIQFIIFGWDRPATIWAQGINGGMERFLGKIEWKRGLEGLTDVRLPEICIFRLLLHLFSIYGPAPANWPRIWWRKRKGEMTAADEQFAFFKDLWKKIKSGNIFIR